MSKTFWDITQESKIEIPEIQRDYAQGRITERVNAIRQSFVSDLLNAINSGHKLNLDFVFGQSIDRTIQADFHKSKHSLEQMLEVLIQYSKDAGVSFTSEIAPKPINSSNDKLLIPFDGQQRLTTLFLLHLYIGIKAQRDISALKNFNYKTRESSSYFIDNIIRHSNVIRDFKASEEDNIKLLSEAIKNESWFFSSWQKDPTVSGMLVVLDEIEAQVIAKGINVEQAWQNLVKHKCIDFDFFDIQEEGFDEDLYVKMNARGKGLTDFENFRAWLEKNHKNSLPEYDWVNKMDKQWLDIFWKTKKEIKDVDINFLAFFKNMALLYRLSKSDTQSDKEYRRERYLIHLMKPNQYTPTSKYEQEKIFTQESLKFIFKILDLFTSNNAAHLNDLINEIWTETFSAKSKKTFTELLLTDFDGLNLYHKTFLFSVLRFLLVKNKLPDEYVEDDWNSLKDWMRVARNIIYNSRIDDNTAYIPAIMSISNLDDEIIQNTHVELSKIATDEDKKKWIGFFSREQQKEECDKVAILSQSEDISRWSELIKQAENHFYFYGQIGFIFKLADKDIVKFEEYLNKLLKLFSKENVSSDNYILQCAFFAFDEEDEWLKSETAYRYKFYKSSTGSSRDRDENWRIVFNSSTKLKVLKELLNNNTCEHQELQNLIDTKKEELSSDDWKFFMLDEPAMLKHCQSAILTIKSEDSVRLLEKTLNSSMQRELRSYHFYSKRKVIEKQYQFPPFRDFWYYTGERGNIKPCIVFGDWSYQKVEYFIDCSYHSNGFLLHFNRRIQGEIAGVIEDKLINDHSFTKEQNLTSQYIKYQDLDSEVDKILDTLNQIDKTQP